MRIRPRFPIAACLLLLLSFASGAIAQSLQWSATPLDSGSRPIGTAAGSATQNHRHLAALDANGNLFISGHTTLGFDPEGYGQFLGKYASDNGAELWRYTGPLPSAFNAVAVNAAGDAFVVGYTVSNTIEHQYVARISGTTGAVVWEARDIPGVTAENYGVDIVLDPSGNPVVLGSGGFAVVTKYDANSGAVLWSVVPGPDVSRSQHPFGLEADRDGNVVGAIYYGEPSIEPSGSLLFKLAGATGARIWATRWGWRSAAIPEIQGLALDGLGKPVLVGKGIAKFSNVDGSLNWQRPLSEDGSPSFAYGVVTADNGDVLATGTKGANSETVVTARLRSLDGATLWASTLAGTDPSHANQAGKSITLDANGDALVAAQAFFSGSANDELVTIHYRGDNGQLLGSARYDDPPSHGRATAELELAGANAAYTLAHFYRSGDGNLYTTALEYALPSQFIAADLQLGASYGEAVAGKDFVIDFSVGNNGPAFASNLRLSAALPAGPAFVWASPSCVASGGSLQCTAATLAPEARATFRLVLRPVAAGSITVDATVASDTPDSPTSNNSVQVSVVAASPPAAQIVPRYRLYNPISQEHLFTTDRNEYDTLGAGGVWQQEGISGRVLDNPGSFNGVTAVPYYRLYCSSNQWHHWTTDPNEYYTLATYPCWGAEGVDGYILPSATTGATQLYRLVYGDGRGLHHWTTDANEYATLTTQYGWFGEGGSGYVIE